jgi:hypothetical protein
MRQVAFLLALVALAGCDLFEDDVYLPPVGAVVEDDSPEGLQARRQQWAAAGVSAYRFRYEVALYCPTCDLIPGYEGPWRVEVRDGVVVERVYEGEVEDVEYDPEAGYTVETLFDELHGAFTVPVPDIEVEVEAAYSVALGFPALTSVRQRDQRGETIHETAVTVTGFERLDRGGDE